MSRFLFAVEADTSRFVGRLCRIEPGMSSQEIEFLRSKYYKKIGEDLVIFDSATRPEMLPAEMRDRMIGLAPKEDVELDATPSISERRSIFNWGKAQDVDQLGKTKRSSKVAQSDQ